MPVQFPGTATNVIHPGQQRIFFGQEGVWGAAPTTSTPGAMTAGASAMVFLEPCQSITSAIQRQPYSATEYAGIPADLFDMVETTHHTQTTINTPWRSNGVAAWSLANMCGSIVPGGATETNVAGPGGANNFSASSRLHTFTPNNKNNVCDTLTVWHDQGDAQFTTGSRGMLQISAATTESIRLTFTPNTALMAEIQFQALFPKYKGASGTATAGYNPPGVTPATPNPAGITKLGADPTYLGSRMMGFQGVSQYFNIMSSAGVKYQNQILSGDITIQRTVQVIESPYSQDPTYLLPGPISVTGNMTFLYDGLGDLTQSNTIFQDYLSFQTLGTLAAQNELRYIDADGNGFDIMFYPIKWTGFTLNAADQSLQVQASFTSFNSLADAMGTTPRMSALRQVQIANNLNFLMLPT